MDEHEEETRSQTQTQVERHLAGVVGASDERSGGSKTNWLVSRSTSREPSAPLLADTQAGKSGSVVAGYRGHHHEEARTILN